MAVTPVCSDVCSASRSTRFPLGVLHYLVRSLTSNSESKMFFFKAKGTLALFAVMSLLLLRRGLGFLPTSVRTQKVFSLMSAEGLPGSLPPTGYFDPWGIDPWRLSTTNYLQLLLVQLQPCLEII